jgi:hypothetical protein
MYVTGCIKENKMKKLTIKYKTTEEEERYCQGQDGEIVLRCNELFSILDEEEISAR